MKITEIKYIIVHELIKERMSKEVKIEFSDDILEVDEYAEKLIEILNNRYGSGMERITYAVFDKQDCNIFPKTYENYHNKSTRENFLDMTCSTLRMLRDQIQNINFAKGGYFIYADYATETQRYFGVFLIRNTKGMLFEKNKSSNSYQINPTIHIDLEKIAVGCRINKTTFSDKDVKYLSFTKKNTDEISDYFIQWISAKELNNNKICTEQLLKLINKGSTELVLQKTKIKWQD